MNTIVRGTCSCTILIVLGLLTTISRADDVVTWLPGMQLGVGYDVTRSQLKGTCVSFTTSPVPAVGTVLNEDHFISEVASSSDVFRRLEVDASASMDVGFASASASVNFVQKNIVSNYDVNVIADVKVQRGWEFASNSTLLPSVPSPTGQTATNFLAQCGTHYIAGVLYGGRMFGLITIAATSQTDFETIEVAIEGSYGGYAVNSNMNDEAAEVFNTHANTVSGFTEGAGGQDIAATPQALWVSAVTFPGVIKTTGGVPMQVLLIPYTGIAIDTQRLFDLAAMYWDYKSAKKEIDYVIGTPDQFYMDFQTWQGFLRGLSTEADNAAQRVSTVITACAANPATCAVPAGLRTPDALRAQLPSRYMSTCAIQTATFSPLEAYPLGVHCGGDTEMDGNRPKTTINARLDTVNGNILDVVVDPVQMQEGQADWTCFRGSARRTVLNVPLNYQGCYVKTINDLTPSTGSLTHTAGQDEHGFREYPNGTGLIASAKCRSDTPSDDEGRLGCSEVRFNPVQIKLTHEEQRMGPNSKRVAAQRSWANRNTVARRLADAEATERTVVARQISTRTNRQPAWGLVRQRRPPAQGIKVPPKFNVKPVGHPPIPD